MKKVLFCFWVGVYALFATNFILLFISFQSDPNNPSTRGKPFRFVEDRYYLCGITDYLVCKDKLYVLYEKRDVLKVYNITGEYQYSYCFPYFQNGRAELYSDGEIVVYEDREGDYYMFRPEARFDRFIEDEEKKTEIEERFLDNKSDKRTQNGDMYKITWTSIKKVSIDNQEAAVISWPFWMGIIVRDYTWYLAIILLVIIIVREMILGNLKFVWKRPEYYYEPPRRMRF